MGGNLVVWFALGSWSTVSGPCVMSGEHSTRTYGGPEELVYVQEGAVSGLCLCLCSRKSGPATLSRRGLTPKLNLAEM